MKEVTDNFAFGGPLSYTFDCPGEIITVDEMVARCNKRHEEALARGEVFKNSLNDTLEPCPSAYR